MTRPKLASEWTTSDWREYYDERGIKAEAIRPASLDTSFESLGLAPLPTSFDPFGVYTTATYYCGKSQLVRAYVSGGVKALWIRCGSLECPGCRKWRAEKALDRLWDGPAGEYFSPENTYTYLEATGVNGGKISWVAAVPLPDDKSKASLHEALKDRRASTGGQYFLIQFSSSAVVFSDKDLGKVPTTGKGRPPGPPHGGIWVTPLVALNYLKAALASPDIVKVSGSKRWWLPDPRVEAEESEEIGFYRNEDHRRAWNVAIAALERRGRTSDEARYFLGTSPQAATVYIGAMATFEASKREGWVYDTKLAERLDLSWLPLPPRFQPRCRFSGVACLSDLNAHVAYPVEIPSRPSHRRRVRGHVLTPCWSP